MIILLSISLSLMNYGNYFDVTLGVLQFRTTFYKVMDDTQPENGFVHHCNWRVE